jgi:hypothetical protein
VLHALWQAQSDAAVQAVDGRLSLAGTACRMQGVRTLGAEARVSHASCSMLMHYNDLSLFTILRPSIRDSIIAHELT